MKTQIELAREGVITGPMEKAAVEEDYSPEIARKKRAERAPQEEQTCTMCGDFCAMKKGIEVFREDIRGDKISRVD